MNILITAKKCFKSLQHIRFCLTFDYTWNLIETIMEMRKVSKQNLEIDSSICLKDNRQLTFEFQLHCYSHYFFCICRRGGEEAKCTKEVCKGGGRDKGGGKCDGKLAILD